MLLIDLSHTSHTRARTGIQRVARSLHAALGKRGRAITFDPYLRAWRTLEPWEQANLAATAPARRRGARWPLWPRLRGRIRRFRQPAPSGLLPVEASGLIVPEVFSPRVGAALPFLLAGMGGPCIGIFHDAIALKLPELTPAGTVARFPAYLVELSRFDGVAAVSEDSRQALLDYWHWLGLRDVPPVRAIALGVERSHQPVAPAAAASAAPVVLSVGSIEGRKNQRALLDACEELWRRGAHFELRLIGFAQAETGRAALDRLRALQTAGRPLRYEGAADDHAVAAAYDACTFTVYPSLMEGFGLPLLESLAHGKPCVCSAQGALGEAARAGGCLPLTDVDAPSLAAAIGRLLDEPAELVRLSAAARQRTFRSWRDYAADLVAWMATVPRRSPAPHSTTP